MLSKRNLYLLVAFVGALALISLLQRQSHQRTTGRASSETLIAGVYTADDLQRIVVGYGTDGEVLVLERQADGWTVATAWGAPASGQRIDSLLGNLSGLTGEFRSDDRGVVPDYGFTDTTTVVITAEGNDHTPAFSIEVGKKAERSVGNFVKRPGENAVYLTNKGVLNDLGLYSGPGRPQAKHFIDLQAYRVDRNEIEAITLHDGDQTVVLRKDFPEPATAASDTIDLALEPDRSVYEWRLLQPYRKAAAKTKADAVQGALASLRAIDVADPGVDRAVYGLAAPTRTAIVELQDSSTVTIAFGGERQSSDDQPAGRYLVVGDEPTIWVVSEYVVNNVFKNYEELLPED